MTDAGKQATEHALDNAAHKEEERIKAEEAHAAGKKAAEVKAAEEAAAKKAALPKELTKEQKEHKAKIDETHKKIQDILKKYGGMESNIGVDHEYWGLQNELRRLMNEPV